MRQAVSLSIALLYCFATSSLAQDAEESTPVEVATQPDSEDSPQIVQFELWVLRLSPDTDVDVLDKAGRPLKDRKAVQSRVRDLEQTGVVTQSQYMMASALDNHQFILQFGSREPRVHGVRQTQFGRASTVQFENVGVIFEGKAKVESHSLILSELRYEDSYLEPTDVAIFEGKDGKETDIARMRTLTQNSTIGCPNGGAVVVMASSGDSSTGQPATLMFLACQVLE